MTASFTPGPWYFHEKLGRSLQYGVTAEKPYNPSVGAARRIAKCGSPYAMRTPNLDSEDRANAMLIAAAPDLYEALQNARRIILALDDPEVTSVRDGPNMKLINAAIAAVRGGE